MLLAAGRGQRMQPLTRHCAKPALPVLDEPIVLRLARELSRKGIDSLVVNLHAHPESVRSALEGSPIPVQFSLEPRLLGSGGGIGSARDWLCDEPFVVLNADMRLDLDLGALCRAHRESGALATLALRDDARKIQLGAIGYDEAGSVRRITNLVDRGDETGSGLFIGAQIMDPGIFDHFPDTENFGVFSGLYRPLLENGMRVSSWLQPVARSWSPIGEPRELLDANLAALAECATQSSPERGREPGEIAARAWLGAGSSVEAGARVGPDCVIGEGARVPAGWQLESCLWLPGADPHDAPGPRSLNRAIAFGAEVWLDD